MRRVFRIMLVLTFIGSGMSALSYLATGLTLPMIQDYYAAGSLPIQPEIKDFFEELINWPRAFFILLGLAYSVSLVGAIIMWRERWLGFHLYAVAQLVALALPLLFIGTMRFDLGDAMITVAIVFFYFMALRNLQAAAADAAIAETSSNADFDNVEEDVDDEDDDDDDED